MRPLRGQNPLRSIAVADMWLESTSPLFVAGDRYEDRCVSVSTRWSNSAAMYWNTSARSPRSVVNDRPFTTNVSRAPARGASANPFLVVCTVVPPVGGGSRAAGRRAVREAEASPHQVGRGVAGREDMRPACDRALPIVQHDRANLAR